MMDKIKAYIRVNRLDSGYSIGIILFCLISVTFVYWLNHGAKYWGWDRDDAWDVTHIFSMALKENNKRMVHSVVVREKWSEIDEWIRNHKEVDCDLDFDGENGNYAVAAELENDTQAQGEIHIFIACGPVVYILDIKNIELEYMDEEWKIVDWGDICESTNRLNSCDDFFD